MWIPAACCNEFSGAYGFFMTAPDLAWYGLLYLNHGRWQTHQIIPGEWIVKSVSRQARDKNYGYCFWLLDRTCRYMANGLFGQYLIVLEDRDSVCVINALKADPGSNKMTQIFQDYFVE